MAASLKPNQVILVDHAVSNSSEEPVIEAGAARVGKLNPGWPFFPATSNIVEGKVLSFAHQLFNQSPAAASVAELADYLALATCGHVFDGWRYLSQAGLALVCGSRSQALHLAYYAELRAAIAILASSGIGILNFEHFSISATGTVNWFKGPTHSVAWRALEQWSRDPVQAMKVVGCFEAVGIPASEWAEACNAKPSLNVIAGNWLQDWSIDLGNLGDDSTLRNESSYRVNLQPTALNALSDREVRFVRNVAALCSPTRNGSFERLDLLLMWDLCRKICELKYPPPIRDSLMSKMAGEMVSWFSTHRFGTKREAAEATRALFEARRADESVIIGLANRANTDVTGVAARAFLLLRLASALMRRQWREIRSISPGGASLWQDGLVASYGVLANLFDAGFAPSDYSLLDEDRIVSQDTLDSWLEVAKPFSAFQLWREASAPLVDLCRFERIGVLASIV